jgi:hypothetical protein
VLQSDVRRSLVSVVVVAACGSSGPKYPALLPPAPMIQNGGGLVLAAPRLVSVTFSDDTHVAEVDDLVKTIGGSKWWKTLSEYGIGQVTSTSAIHLAMAAPPTTTDDAIKTWLANEITTDSTEFGDPTNTLYVIYYPTTTSITIRPGETTCAQYGAYHSEAQLGGSHVAYAVVPLCMNGFGGLTDLTELTADTSHEIAEGVTDPFVTDMKAWGVSDAMQQVWTNGGAEIGDLCVDSVTGMAAVYVPDDLPYTVQRLWSNTSAAAGHDPCLPIPDPANSVYFNSVPELTTPIALHTIGGADITQWGVHIAEGDSAVVPLDLFSDRPTSGPWTLSATDLATLLGNPARLEFTFDKPSGVNGDQIMMTIHVLSTNTLQGGEIFWVQSTLDGRTTRWLGVVGG